MNQRNASEQEVRGQARRKINNVIGFNWHLRAYLLVCALLVVINLLTTPAFLWCLFPIGGWGIAVALHYFALRGHDDREALIEAEVQRKLASSRAGASREESAANV